MQLVFRVDVALLPDNIRQLLSACGSTPRVSMGDARIERAIVMRSIVQVYKVMHGQYLESKEETS
jgi:hypothetical protein